MNKLTEILLIILNPVSSSEEGGKERLFSGESYEEGPSTPTQEANTVSSSKKSCTFHSPDTTQTSTASRFVLKNVLYRVCSSADQTHVQMN